MPLLSHLPDSTLLARIAEQPSDARVEMQEFYARHIRYLYAVVNKQCARLGFGDSEVEDLVQDTFARAFDRASTYRPSQSDEDDAQRRWTRAWLGTIARNLILAALRAPREVLVSDELDQHAAAERPSDPPSERNRHLTALRTAIATLGEREQDVLRVSAMYYRAGETHQRLPNEVSAELARRWQTSNENIRAIRSRALKRVLALTNQLLDERPQSDNSRGNEVRQ